MTKTQDYLTTAEACRVMGISRRRLGTLLAEGSVAGAKRVTVGAVTVWQIPKASAEAPRRRAGRPVVKKEGGG